MHPPALRCTRERALQTLAYEALALLLVAPLFGATTGSSAGNSLLVVGCVSIASMVWAAAFNTTFDRVEYRLTGRVASVRSHRARLAHVVALEASSTVVTWPVIWLTSELGWMDALVADVGLTVLYTAYGYVFHLAFDRLRPVTATARVAVASLVADTPVR